MDIYKHFNMLLDKYNLKSLYYKYIIISIFSSSIKEGFYWSLIYFNQIVQEDNKSINKYGFILINIYLLSIPAERYFNYIKNLFMKELKKANYHFFLITRFKNIIKPQYLTINLVNYSHAVEHLTEGLEYYIHNIKIKYDIPLRFVSLNIISFTKNLKGLISLFVVYIIILNQLNKQSIDNEILLTNQQYAYEKLIRNYVIHSKTYLINDYINNEYLTDIINNIHIINNQLNESTSKLDLKINILIVIYILIILKLNIKMLSPSDFLYYFLLIYDIEYIGDKVTAYYKNKMFYIKLNKRLTYLYKFDLNNTKKVNSNNNFSIQINKIINTMPKLTIRNLIIQKYDHILVNGISGSGKTSLLYILKGVLVPDIIDIYPSINIINASSYLTLVDNNQLYSSNLYDIITNYELNPNHNLIIYCLNNSKFKYAYDHDYFIDIEKLSSGEKIRLVIAKLIYTIITNNYNILLFDEIDTNLNDDLAIEICNNIKLLFANKIILYITHNEKVKKLFNKYIYFNNGNIVEKKL